MKISALTLINILCTSLTLSILSGCIAPVANTKNFAVQLKSEDHPLVDKIWDVQKKQYVQREQIEKSLLMSQFILLGETHDNPKHHEHQSWVINYLKKNNIKSSVAFEMITPQQMKHVAKKPYENVNEFISALNKEKNGWEYEKHYKGIFDSVLQSRYPIIASSLDRDTIMKYMSKGGKQVPQEIKATLVNNELDAKGKKLMEQEIIDSHCGMDNKNMVKAMMLAQRVKDVVMSNSMLQPQSSSDVMVLISGSGHARKDRGVPMYLKKEQGTSKILSIAWMEVNEEHNDAKPYVDYWGTEALPFDYVWFTARADRPNPCIEFRKRSKHFSKHHNKKSKKDEKKP